MVRGPRLTYWSAFTLAPFEAAQIELVRTHGCSVVMVGGDAETASVTYSVGLHDTLGQAELLVVGLDPPVGHAVIRALAARMAAGHRLADRERLAGVLDGVEVELRYLEPTALSSVMTMTGWFHGGWDFPVMQVVYPDAAGRFAWEDGFDPAWRAAQPLLFPHALDPAVERAFLGADAAVLADGFPIAADAIVFTTQAIAAGADAIVQVIRDVEDEWQFHGHGESTDTNLATVTLRSLLHQDPSLREVADLPTDHVAWRDAPGEPWTRERMDPDEPSTVD